MLEHFEKWLPVVGYEGLYEVSNCGRVRSLARTLNQFGENGGGTYIREGKMLSPFPSNYGYLCVSLFAAEGHKMRQKHVAHLVAEAWIGLRPGGYHIDHKDGDKKNNAVWNLRYIPPKENANAGNFDRNTPQGEDRAGAKLSNADIIEIRRLKTEGMRNKDIAQIFKVSRCHISNIIAMRHRRNK
jgi:hypothetical protein